MAHNQDHSRNPNHPADDDFGFFRPNSNVFPLFPPIREPDPSANSSHFIPTNSNLGSEQERHHINSENHLQSLFSTVNETDSKLAQESQELLRLLLNHLSPEAENMKDGILKDVNVQLEKIRDEILKQVNFREEMSRENDDLKDEIKRLNNIVTELKKNFQNLGQAIWGQVITNLERYQQQPFVIKPYHNDDNKT
ncbi:hypothetical protein QC760_010624 [Botrytis cinerea]